MITQRSIFLLGLVIATCPTLLACGSDDPIPAGDELLAPPPEGQGIQYQLTTKIDPGVDAAHCKFVQAPPEGLFINHDEVRFTAGSHHFLLYETPYTSIPTQTEAGQPIDTSGVFDCSNGALVDFKVTKILAGSQNADGDSFLSLPSDVAVRVEPGQVLLMQTHYINASAEVIEPEVRVNLHTIPEAQVKEKGDILFWYNPFIKVGAKSTSRARMKCMAQGDITITNVQAHMHARGAGYAAALAGADPFYTSPTWENVPVKRFDAGMKIAAGTWIDYYCDYNNAEAADVYQGLRSSDEMCMLIGSYYPAVPITSKCSADPARPQETRSLGAEWVGSGQATCAATLSCAQAAASTPGNVVKNITPCILGSDPAISKEMSDAVRCLLLNRADAPTACEAQFDACAAK